MAPTGALNLVAKMPCQPLSDECLKYCNRHFSSKKGPYYERSLGQTLASYPSRRSELRHRFNSALACVPGGLRHVNRRPARVDAKPKAPENHQVPWGSSEVAGHSKSGTIAIVFELQQAYRSRLLGDVEARRTTKSSIFPTPSWSS